MGRRLIFLGPQGSGKGTQATRLARLMGVPHVATGDMLRAAVAAGTGLGSRAAAIMAAGDLVPDELVVAMVAERLGRPDAACGYILDGFPRNVPQAKALDAELDGGIEAIVHLDVPHGELMERMLLRAAEQGREDDTQEVIARRLEIYWEQTAPLADYYRESGIPVFEVNGLGSIDEVTARVALALAVER